MSAAKRTTQGSSHSSRNLASIPRTPATVETVTIKVAVDYLLGVRTVIDGIDGRAALHTGESLSLVDSFTEYIRLGVGRPPVQFELLSTALTLIDRSAWTNLNDILRATGWTRDGSLIRGRVRTVGHGITNLRIRRVCG